MTETIETTDLHIARPADCWEYFKIAYEEAAKTQRMPFNIREVYALANRNVISIVGTSDLSDFFLVNQHQALNGEINFDILMGYADDGADPINKHHQSLLELARLCGARFIRYHFKPLNQKITALGFASDDLIYSKEVPY